MLTKMSALRYLLAVVMQLPDSWKQKKLLWKQIRSSVRDCAAEDSSLSYGQLCARLGAPAQITSAYLNEMPPEELLETVDARNSVVRILLAGVIIGAVLWVAVIAIGILSIPTDENGNAIVTVIEIPPSE